LAVVDRSPFSVCVSWPSELVPQEARRRVLSIPAAVPLALTPLEGRFRRREEERRRRPADWEALPMVDVWVMVSVLMVLVSSGSEMSMATSP